MISSKLVRPAEQFRGGVVAEAGDLSSRGPAVAISPSFAASTIIRGKVFVDRQQLEHADPPLVAAIVAHRAALRLVDRGVRRIGPADRGGFGGRQLPRLATFGAQLAAPAAGRCRAGPSPPPGTAPGPCR